MATSVDLMNDVYANFLAAYAQQTAAGNVVVSFEPLGLMPGLAFKSQHEALEKLLADEVALFFQATRGYGTSTKRAGIQATGTGGR